MQDIARVIARKRSPVPFCDGFYINALPAEDMYIAAPAGRRVVDRRAAPGSRLSQLEQGPFKAPRHVDDVGTVLANNLVFRHVSPPPRGGLQGGP